MYHFRTGLAMGAIFWETCVGTSSNFTDVGQPYGLTTFGFPLSIREAVDISYLAPYVSLKLQTACLPRVASPNTRFTESISVQAMPDQSSHNGTQLLIVHIDYYDPNWGSTEQRVIDCISAQISHFYSVASGSTLDTPSPTLERLFFWVDTERKVNSGSQKINKTSFAFGLAAEKAGKMRNLTQELRTGGYFPGLAERARAVGYFAESMHLQPQNDGTYLLLVHLDHYGSFEALNLAIITYPGNYFTQFWGPQYPAIVGNTFVDTETVSMWSLDPACEPITLGVKEPWECAIRKGVNPFGRSW